MSKDEKQWEDEIRDSLRNNPKEMEKMKEEIWAGIEEQLIEERKVGRMRKKKENVVAKGLGIGLLAASLLAVFFIASPMGHATVDRIREIFEPEKEIVEEIEGIEEEVVVDLVDTRMGYILYMDSEHLKMTKENGIDRIVPKDDIPFTVYMDIYQDERGKEEVEAEILGNLEENYEHVQDDGEVSSPIEGRRMWAHEGWEWDDVMVRYYVVDDTMDGTYVIKQVFFLEGEEGWGARFENLLKTFELVEIEE